MINETIACDKVRLCKKHHVNKNVYNASLFVQLAVTSILEIFGLPVKYMESMHSMIYEFSLFHFLGSSGLQAPN